MQKNDKFYTFLFKHSSKNRIYIRKIAISKSRVHFGSIGFLLLASISLLGLGINGMVNSDALAAKLDTSDLAASTAVSQNQQPQQNDINYSRPGDAADMTANSGGPEVGDENDSETSEIDLEVKAAAAELTLDNRPNMWPHEGKINNEFGFRRNPFGGRAYEFHPGMDINGERGENVLAPAGGTVIKAGWTGGYGNMVEIDHGNGLTTRYGHMSKIEVQVGDTITRGELIGLIGSTGRSTGPHLHYELRLHDRPVNPRHVLPTEPLTVTKNN